MTIRMATLNLRLLKRNGQGTRGGGGGYLGSVLLGMCRWPLRAPSPL